MTKRLGRSTSHIAILVVALITLTATGCAEQDTATAARPIPPEVEVAAARARTIPIVMEFPATVQSMRAVEIVSQVSGPLIQRTFEEGTYVEQNAPLYVIDPRPFQARVDAASAQLREDTAETTFWQSEVERTTKLETRGAASREQQQKSAAQLAQYQAAVAKDQANIESARLDVEYAHIKAPFRGYIEATRVHVGAQIVARQTVMTTLVQTDPVHVVFSVSRAQLTAIQRLQIKGYAPDQLTDFKARVRLGDGSLFSHQGQVDFVSAQVDPQTDTLVGRAELPNPPGTTADVKLIAGQYVAILITVGQRPSAILIPKPALVETQAGRYVYLVAEGGKVEKRAVEINSAFEGNWVVSKGLAAGDKVIVSGLQHIRPGIEVTVQPSTDKSQ